MKTIYIFPTTGAIGTYEDWYYKDDDGITQNAVDNGKAVEAIWDYESEAWVRK